MGANCGPESGNTDQIRTDHSHPLNLPWNRPKLARRWQIWGRVRATSTKIGEAAAEIGPTSAKLGSRGRTSDAFGTRGYAPPRAVARARHRSGTKRLVDALWGGPRQRCVRENPSKAERERMGLNRRGGRSKTRFKNARAGTAQSWPEFDQDWPGLGHMWLEIG